MRSRRWRYRDLPILWKVLAPFLVLMLCVGGLGAFVIVRDLSAKADLALSQDLARRALDARSLLRDRELYLHESANLATALEGMNEAAARRDAATAGRLLQSVMALKTDLNLAVISDPAGRGLAEYRRPDPGDAPAAGAGLDWSGFEPVQAVRAATDDRKASGFITVGDTAMLAIVAPVCSPGSVCGAGPVAVVGIEVDALAKDAAGDLAATASPAAGSPTAIALYGADGGLLASHGRPFSRSLPPGRSAGVHSGRVGAEAVATVFSPYEVQGRTVGTLAVSIPTEPARGGVRDAGVRLAVAVLAAVIGAAGIGALLSRRLVSQVRSLLDATRALGRGNLSARAVALGRDELGELVDGVNQTAEELQASYEMLEARVAQRTDEIQRLLQERTDFFTNMSHELRTPLALILAEAKLIEDPSYRKNAVWAKKTAAKLRVSTEQVLAVVNDILELAEADAGQLHVDVADVAVDEIVEELRPTIEGLAHAADLGVTFDVPPRMPAARADRRRVRDVVLNLVDNAVKYTPNGGMVSIGLSASNGSVAVEVSDTGIGVPPDVGDRLFEPFYRVETSRAQHGKESTGLGLAIAKRIVEAQGGTLTYRSESDNGSTFTMRLPRSTLGEQ